MGSESWFTLLQRQPEYVHVLLNPLPIYGLAMGVFALVLALFLRHRAAHITALAIILVSAVSVWPVKHFGEEGYDRVLSMTDQPGEHWLKTHEARADKVLWLYAVAAAVALAALIAPIWVPRSGPWLSVATLIISLAALGAGIWIARAGGKIRHREFRTSLDPPVYAVFFEKSGYTTFSCAEATTSPTTRASAPIS